MLHDEVMSKNDDSAPLTRDIAPFGLRMPPDLKARIKQSADYNGRSMNAEILLVLEANYPAPISETELFEKTLFNSLLVAGVEAPEGMTLDDIVKAAVADLVFERFDLDALAKKHDEDPSSI